MLAAMAVAVAAPAAVSFAQATDPIAAEQRALIVAKRQSALAATRSQQLDAAATAEQDRAAKARGEEAAVAARIEQAEADIAAAEARIAIVRAMLAEQRRGLAQQQGPIVRLMAALQSFARRPAIIGVVQPGSVDDLVHVRAVLGTVTPAIARRTQGLRGDLARTRALEANAALAVKSLADGRAALDRQQLALARLEVTHRARSAALSRTALHESDRAIALGEQARDIVDRMDVIGDAATTRAALADLADPAPRPGSGTLDALRWPNNDAPYALPVAGRLVTGLGEVSPAGVRARGLTIAVAPDAVVRAPAAGRIAYAQPFRDYGTIVIIVHGDGWTTLITQLAGATVRRGDRVIQGRTIGRAGSGDDAQVTVELRRRGRPIDMIPLLG
ncbi:metalloendopeptidase [Sphingomonas koreensis]|nr:metalloendopeptidase [Sphingomonas koreensis]